MNAIGVGQVADLIYLEPDGWFVVVVEPSQINTIVEQFREEFVFLMDDDNAGTLRVFAPPLDQNAVVEELAQLKPEDIAILPLSAELLESIARVLDYRRGRLIGRAKGVIVTDDAGLPVIATCAPNLWSWIGARMWKIDHAAGQLDAKARLESLRTGTGLTDAEVIARAQAHTLPPDPIFAEWLVLLGKGELLGP